MFQKFTHALAPHLSTIKAMNLTSEFAQDQNRDANYTLEAAGLRLNYAQQPINDSILKALSEFLEHSNFRAKIEAMFVGDKINITEDRAVLHTWLRDPNAPEFMQAEFSKMITLVNDVYAKSEFTDVVNIGIGGSDLGPRMVVRALRYDWQNKVRVHFVSNVDGTDMYETLQGLNPDTTLFIVASKSFTTQETLMNAETAKVWLGKRSIAKHFIGITSKPEKAEAWGIAKDRIFAMWDFIGGRYSLWSVIGLPIALAVGIENFKQLLAGAHALDENFRYAHWTENMPVLLAIIAIINQNFLGAQSHAILPYDQTLELLPSYLQQADMESNGKRVTLQNHVVDYQTGVTLWGGVGTNGQHAFHQLLHQGTLRIPMDLILPLHPRHPYQSHHKALMANCYGQKQAFLEGRVTDQPYKDIPGNRPVNLITCNKLDPKTLGALIALYEQKIFAQSLIWDINAFDQFGVELGKVLAEKLLSIS